MRRVLLGYLIMVLCACGHATNHATAVRSGSDAPTTRPHQNDQAVSVNIGVVERKHLKGLYFGTSESSGEVRAWLIHLDSRSGKGKLYMPPENLELTLVEVSPTGHVTFRSGVGFGDLVYRFNGRLSSDVLEGEIRISRARPGSNETVGSVPVSLRRLAQPTEAARASHLGGVYSNVEYIEEGGDLVGDELILIPTDTELVGIFSSYENEMLPYATIDLKLPASTIKFKTRTAAGEESYEGVVSPDSTVILKRTDANADPDAEPIELNRIKRVAAILE